MMISHEKKLIHATRDDPLQFFIVQQYERFKKGFLNLLIYYFCLLYICLSFFHTFVFNIHRPPMSIHLYYILVMNIDMSQICVFDLNYIFSVFYYTLAEGRNTF